MSGKIKKKIIDKIEKYRKGKAGVALGKDVERGAFYVCLSR